MLRRSIAMILICIFTPAVTIACGSDSGSDAVADQLGQVERGRVIFAENCAACHGQNGEGQPNWRTTNPDGTLPAPPLNGDGHTWHHGDGTLYKQVSLGGAYLEEQGLTGFKSGMPAFEELLAHQEIIDVLTYVKSLWANQTIHGMSKQEAQARVSENDPFPVTLVDD